MEELREFVFSLMIISISCAAVSMFISESTSVSRYVHFLVGIIVTSVLLSPLQSALGILPDLVSDRIMFDEEEGVLKSVDYTDAIIETACGNIEAGISDELEKRFDVRPVQVGLECDTHDINNIVIEKVTVFYRDTNILLSSDTVNFVSELMKCECEVKEIDEDT